MATRLSQFIEKAAGSGMTPTDLATGGLLSNQQARQFLRDAIAQSVILKRADAFDSMSPKYDIPKLSFGTRVMHAGTSGARLATANQAKPDTDNVTISTELFKGEVPIAREVFEDNIEREGMADTIMAEITAAVGRDLEDIAIKSDPTSTDADFAKLPDGGIVSQLLTAAVNVSDATAATSYKGMFKAAVSKLPKEYRQLWASLVFYVAPDVADGYADELGDRATQLGDSNVDSKPVQRYRGIPVIEVPLLSGTDTWGATAHDFSTYALLTVPQNVKVGFHRRVEVERYRDPLSDEQYWLPRVRFDVKVAQPEACVLIENVPALA